MTLHWAPLPVECVHRGSEAPFPQDLPRDISDETVKALVDCLVITIFLAVTTTTVVGVASAIACLRVALALTRK